MGGGGGGAKNGWSISRGGRPRALAEWRRGVVFFGLSWAAAAAAAAAASKSMNLPPPPGPPGMYFRFFEGGPSGESKEPLLDDLREDLGLLRDGRPEIECRTVGAIIQERAFGYVYVARWGWRLLIGRRQVAFRARLRQGLGRNQSCNSQVMRQQTRNEWTQWTQRTPEPVKAARRDEVFGYLVKAETAELAGPVGLRRQAGLEAPPQLDIGT